MTPDDLAPNPSAVVEIRTTLPTHDAPTAVATRLVSDRRAAWGR